MSRDRDGPNSAPGKSKLTLFLSNTGMSSFAACLAPLSELVDNPFVFDEVWLFDVTRKSDTTPVSCELVFDAPCGLYNPGCGLFNPVCGLFQSPCGLFKPGCGFFDAACVSVFDEAFVLGFVLNVFV